MLHIKKTISQFSKTHIIVVGDVMLDRFIIGDVTRISPEAPVPVVSKKGEVCTLGGAGNVAHNVVSLGGKVSLFGMIGEDSAGEKIQELVNNTRSIKNELVSNKKYTTTEKTRIVSHDQHMLRVDTEKITTLTKQDEEKVLNRYKELLKKADIVVLSDYLKGLFTETFIKELITSANKENIRVIVDTKPVHAHFFKHVYCVKPNKKEALQMSSKKEIPQIAKDIARKLKTNVLITLGEEGMYVFENGKGRQIKTKKRTIFDVVGAGDTVIAALALSLATKKVSLMEGAAIADHAAGVVIGKHGTATVTQKELLSSFALNR